MYCFDSLHRRFPNLTVISGHLGERIPSDLVRIDDRMSTPTHTYFFPLTLVITELARQVVAGLPMKKNVTFYFRHNLLETTSGNFATDLVKFHAQQIGLERILFSVDYPFVPMEQGAEWLDNEVPKFLNKREALALKRGLAIEVLRLNR